MNQQLRSLVMAKFYMNWNWPPRKLFIEEEIIVDIVVPSLISPIDYSEIAISIKNKKSCDY